MTSYLKGNVFFKPWIGKDYKKGLMHKKIMVLGASHYCNHNDDCPFFNDCTKSSRDYESKCSFYKGMLLSDTTVNEVNDFLKGEANDAYGNFTNFMVNEMGLVKDKGSFWDAVVFANYVQHFLPHWKTEANDIYSQDYEALKEIVQLHQPDIIIVWGAPVGNDLKKKERIATHLPKPDDNYLFKQRIGGREYLFVNCYHPSEPSSARVKWFTNDKVKFREQLELALNI